MSSIVICKRDISNDIVNIRFTESYIFVLDLKKKYAALKCFESHHEIGVRDQDSKVEHGDGDILLDGATVSVFRKMLDQPKNQRNQKIICVSTNLNANVTKTSANKTCTAESLSDETRLRKLMDDLDEYLSPVDYKKLSKVHGDILRKQYVCNICNLQGHHIQSCPKLATSQKTSARPQVKKCTGIPMTQLVVVNDINIPGVMQTNNGELVLTKAAYATYENRIKNKPGDKTNEPRATETYPLLPFTNPLKRKSPTIMSQDLGHVKRRKFNN